MPYQLVKSAKTKRRERDRTEKVALTKEQLRAIVRQGIKKFIKRNGYMTFGNFLKKLN